MSVARRKNKTNKQKKNPEQSVPKTITSVAQKKNFGRKFT